MIRSAVDEANKVNSVVMNNQKYTWITRLHGGFFPKFGGFCPFFDYQTARGLPPWWWQFFLLRKPIIFNNIIMHLIHSYTHFDLDHSCSTLHMSRYTVTWSSFSVGRAMETPLPNWTAATTLKIAAKNLVEPRSFLIMWAKPDPLTTYVVNDIAYLSFYFQFILQQFPSCVRSDFYHCVNLPPFSRVYESSVYFPRF